MLLTNAAITHPHRSISDSLVEVRNSLGIGQGGDGSISICSAWLSFHSLPASSKETFWALLRQRLAPSRRRLHTGVVAGASLTPAGFGTWSRSEQGLQIRYKAEAVPTPGGGKRSKVLEGEMN